VAVGLHGYVTGVVEDGESLGGRDVEQQRDLEKVGAFGVSDLTIPPGGSGQVLEVLTVGALRGVVLESEFDGQPGDGE
jgi:hypothetical protein